MLVVQTSPLLSSECLFFCQMWLGQSRSYLTLSSGVPFNQHLWSLAWRKIYELAILAPPLIKAELNYCQEGPDPDETTFSLRPLSLEASDFSSQRDPSLYSYSKHRMHWKTIRQTDLADWCHKQSSSYSSSLKSEVHTQREGKHFYSLWALHTVAHHQPCLSSLLVQCCLFSADGSMPSWRGTGLKFFLLIRL